jgi:hypothetical protein
MRPAAAALRSERAERPTAVPAARRRRLRSDAEPSTVNSMMWTAACVRQSISASPVGKPVSVRIRNVQAFVANKVRKSQKT